MAETKTQSDLKNPTQKSKLNDPNGSTDPKGPNSPKDLNGPTDSNNSQPNQSNAFMPIAILAVILAFIAFGVSGYLIANQKNITSSVHNNSSSIGQVSSNVTNLTQIVNSNTTLVTNVQTALEKTDAKISVLEKQAKTFVTKEQAKKFVTQKQVDKTVDTSTAEYKNAIKSVKDYFDGVKTAQDKQNTITNAHIQALQDKQAHIWKRQGKSLAEIWNLMYGECTDSVRSQGYNDSDCKEKLKSFKSLFPKAQDDQELKRITRTLLIIIK